MSGTWPRVFRDPVHDAIVFQDNPCDRLLLQLLDTRELQRLRRIKQLGFTEFVFPGANHSRFSHSLGVLHIARMFLDQLARRTGQLFPDEQRALVLAASLLHDIGHGPFSHAFEKVTGKKHEARTLEIIRDSGTEVNQKLRAFAADMPDRLALFFDEDADEGQVAANVPVYLTQIVSSQLDADRCDYLLRDSYATGTNYGNYDLPWLVLQLCLQPDRKRFFLGRKAKSAAEAYIFARFHMYRTVYFHKTTRSAEVMLKLVFQRFKELVKEGSATGQAISSAVPRNFAAALLDNCALSEYLDLDDHSVTEFLKACSKADDRILQGLAEGLLNRHLYKAVDATDASAGAITDFVRVAQARVQQEAASGYSFVVDTPADTPYKPYDPDAEKPATQIYVETLSGERKEISLVSDTVAQLRKQYELVRYYFPDRLRPEMDQIADRTLRKGKP